MRKLQTCWHIMYLVLASFCILILGCQDDGGSQHVSPPTNTYPLHAYRDVSNGNLIVTNNRTSRGVRLVAAGEYILLDTDGIYPDNSLPHIITKLAEYGYNSVRIFLVYRDPPYLLDAYQILPYAETSYGYDLQQHAEEFYTRRFVPLMEAAVKSGIFIQFCVYARQDFDYTRSGWKPWATNPLNIMTNPDSFAFGSREDVFSVSSHSSKLTRLYLSNIARYWSNNNILFETCNEPDPLQMEEIPPETLVTWENMVASIIRAEFPDVLISSSYENRYVSDILPDELDIFGFHGFGGHPLCRHADIQGAVDFAGSIIAGNCSDPDIKLDGLPDRSYNFSSDGCFNQGDCSPIYEVAQRIMDFNLLYANQDSENPRLHFVHFEYMDNICNYQWDFSVNQNPLACFETDPYGTHRKFGDLCKQWNPFEDQLTLEADTIDSPACPDPDSSYPCPETCIRVPVSDTDDLPACVFFGKYNTNFTVWKFNEYNKLVLNQRVNCSPVTDIICADINSDKTDEIIVSSDNGNQVFQFDCMTNHYVESSTTSIPAEIFDSDNAKWVRKHTGPDWGPGSLKFAVADFNADYYDDIYILSPGREDTILLRNKAGNVISSYTMPGSIHSTAASIIDFERNGTPDIFLATGEGVPSVLFKHVKTPDGFKYVPYGLYMINDRVDDVVTLDCDRDGRDDLLLTGAKGVILLHNVYP